MDREIWVTLNNVVKEGGLALLIDTVANKLEGPGTDVDGNAVHQHIGGVGVNGGKVVHGGLQGKVQELPK